MASPDPIIIRLLDPADSTLMGQHIARQAADSGIDGQLVFHPYPPGELPDFEKLAPRRRTRYLKTLDQPGWSRAFGAFHDGSLIGHTELDAFNIGSGAHRAELSIGIEIPFRGNRLGARLSRAALDWARTESPLEWIDLHVFAHNQPALALYRSLGFSLVGTTTDRFRVSGQTIDDIHMQLRLHGTP